MISLLFDIIPSELLIIVIYYCEPVSRVTLFDFDTTFKPIIVKELFESVENGSEVIEAAIEKGDISFM